MFPPTRETSPSPSIDGRSERSARERLERALSERSSTSRQSSRRSAPQGRGSSAGRPKHVRDASPGHLSTGSSDSDEDAEEDQYFEDDIGNLAPLLPTNELFKEACDFRTYRLENKNARYVQKDRSNLRRMRKDLTVQMRAHTFDGSQPIGILNFLKEFQDACNVNGIHEGAARWLFREFVTGPARSLLDTTTSGKKRSKAGRLDTYCAVVHYLLKKYARDDAIAKVHQEISNYRHLRAVSAEEYAQELLNKSNRCGAVYPENVLLGYFVEGMHASIRKAVRSYLSKNPDCDMIELATYASEIEEIAKGPRQAEENQNGRAKNQKKGGDVATVTSGKQSKKKDKAPSVSSGSAPSTASAPAPASAVFAVGHAAPSAGSTYTTSVGTLAPSGPRYTARASSPGPVMEAQPCRFCLGFGHDQSNCPMVPQEKLGILNKAREDNLQKLRTLGYYNRSRSRERSVSPGRTHSYSTRQSLPPVERPAEAGPAPKKE